MIKNIEPYKGKKKQNPIISNIKGFFIAVVIALVIRVVLVEPYKIPSESMYPNIFKGDMIMSSKLTYGIYIPVLNYKLPWFYSPKENNIVLFQTPTYKSPGKFTELFNFVTFGIFGLDNNDRNPKYFIKRVVGAPGHFLDIEDPRKTDFKYQIIIDGKPILLTPYLGAIKFQDSGDYNFYIEKGQRKNYIIQYKKQAADFFDIGDDGFLGDVYVPKKGDKLDFIIQGQKMNLKELKESEQKKLIPDIANEVQIKMRLLKKNQLTDKEEVVREITLTGSGFRNFYYTLKPNTILTSENIYTLLEKGEVEVRAKKSYYLMMGDNRDNSSDSRYWGFVPNTSVIGSSMFRYYPFPRFGRVSLKIPSN